MNIEQLRDFCLGLPGTTECFPFDDVTLVFKVGAKMFALTSLDAEPWVNLKCNPELAIELRERYPEVQPGYHMNKKHWNTVILDGAIGPELIKEWVEHSYQLAVKSLPKKMRAEIDNL